MLATVITLVIPLHSGGISVFPYHKARHNLQAGFASWQVAAYSISISVYIYIYIYIYIIIKEESVHCSVHRMLDLLGWPSLEQRRKTSRLGVMYKIYNGLVQCPIIKTKLVPPPSASAAPAVNSLASSPPERSTEAVPFYPAPSGTGS